jgi:voltage-gated potassium channel
MEIPTLSRKSTVNPFRRLLPIAIALLAIALIGIVGFMAIEHWTPLESAYMVVITLLTIGFQEVHPLSAHGRIFTMIIAILGVGTAVYAAGKAAETIVEGEIFGYRVRRKMDKRIKELKEHYIIAGFGRVGHQVAADFQDAGIAFVVIDSKPETVNELQPKGIPHIIGDPTLDEVLEEAGIQKAKGLVACSDSDVSNVYVTLSARALNAKLYIVARASQRETEKKLAVAGADRVISPYFISGRRMAAMAMRPVTSDFLDTVSHGGGLEFRLHEIPVPATSALVNKTLGQSLIRTKCGAVVLAIHKVGGTFELQPQASSTISQGDTLVVIGTAGQIEGLTKLLG